MIAKIPSLLSAALVTAMAGQAAAHDDDGCQDGARAPAPAPAVYTPVGYPAAAHDHSPPGYRGREYGARAYRGGGDVEDLRRSDLNRDGVVTLAEALQEGRHEFVNSDRDRNRVLTRREVSWGNFAHDDRDRNGIVSYGEHQESIRRAFYRFDTNRDGVLARYELGPAGPRGAGWRR
ncbi:MAG TPA: hypothetical protein VFS67_24485 [Polyangiaceae bacterium]|jgi:hypothetical protein|nr:hypothetical protein [Polyangiaceae bacterium]